MAVATALVAVEQTVYHFDKPFSYFIPESLQKTAVPGMRVMVPFGGGNRSRQGIILAVSHDQTAENLKPLFKTLDDSPALNQEQLKLVGFLKEQTFCTLFDAAKLMYPTGLNYRIITKYRLLPNVQPTLRLSDECKEISQVLSHSDEPLTAADILAKCSLADDEKYIQTLVKHGAVERVEDSLRSIGDKTMRTVQLNPEHFEADGTALSDRKLTVRQKEIIRLLGEVGVASVKEICYFTGISEAVVNNLVKKGLLVRCDVEVLRTPYDADVPDGKRKNIELNPEQNGVYESLKSFCSGSSPQAALLFGVTGSGKTQVYLKLIDDVIDSGRSVLVTVPEISLTPQTLSIFRARYGDKVAVMHSGLSLGERLDEWKRVKNGQAKIVVGTRSAVFAPLENIGLIVMDEEQEHSYKSDASPRYHARDVARFRAAENNALLLLCSATPSVESYMKAKSGIYYLEKLPNRYGDARLPDVITADMRDELSSGNETGIGSQLYDLISETLSSGKQAILLLNRRGYNTFIACRECGAVVNCDSCSISMVYHRDNDRVMCHYCGKSLKKPKRCPKCSGEFIRYSGAGTQRAAEQLETLFPNARILRMDADTTMQKGAHKRGLDAFAAGEYDILIGTQMVAKGLDFPNVTLVGIIDADGIFYNNDFRSYERAFSLLTQVIGRAGRSSQDGTAVIQTTTPDNELICLSASQDYESFFEDEIELRRLMEYPPYCDICMVGFVGLSEVGTRTAAYDFLELLKSGITNEYADVRVKIMGPSPAQVLRMNSKYRYKLIIKCKNQKRFRALLRETLCSFGKEQKHKNITVYADMNPSNVL